MKKLYVLLLAVMLLTLAACLTAHGFVAEQVAGGVRAPDDLRLGHLTQEWLATSDDPRARSTGGYWHHQRLATAHPAVHDEDFQRRLLDELARFTGITL